MEKSKPLTRAVVRLALLGAACALVAPRVAHGDAKYKRATATVSVKQTEATRKLEAKKPTGKEKQPAPEISADDFIQIETKVQNIRDDQIVVLKEIIRDTEDNDPEKADLLFRLAELYAQKQRHFHFLAMEALTKAGRTRNRGEKANFNRVYKDNLNKEKKQLIDAVRIYKALVENPHFRNFPRMDEALFYYAYTLTQGKYNDEARKIYYRLIKDYPNSKYIPDAYLSFAEWYFANNDLDNAEKFYDKVLQFPKSGVFHYAMYMKGWVYYNRARWQDSLETWYKVAQATERNKKQRTLNRAAKKDIVRAYAEVGKAELAYKYFTRVDSSFAFTMLTMLGEYYLAQGKAEKTIYVYREMIAIDQDTHAKKGDGKLDKNTCEWQYTVVRAMNTIGTYEQKVKELERLLKFWRHLKEGNLIPENNLAECSDNAKATTGELAKIWHNEANKTLNYEIMAYAEQLYRLYVEYFPDADDAGEMTYWLAECTWKRAETEKNPSLAAQRWEDAAVAFQGVVEAGKVKPEWIKESAKATVLAWKNALNVDVATELPEEKKGKKDETPKPLPIPEKEAKMMAAFDTYIKYVTDKKDNDLVDMKFFKGRIYWKYRHYDKAIPFFSDILETRPDHEAAEFAANLLLDSLAMSGQDEELVRWVKKLLGMKKLMEEHPQLSETCERLNRESERRLAERYEKDARYKDCGDMYRMIYNKYQASGQEDLAQVLYNAGVCYEKAKLIGQAVQMRQLLVDKFPKKNEAQKALYALGFNYAQIAFYNQAADKYEEYAKRFGGEKNAVDALNNATFFRRGLGQDDKAIDDTNFFIKQYGRKKPKEAAAAHFSIADVYAKRNDRNAEIKHLTEYLKRWGGKGGVDRQIAAHVRIGEILWKQSCKAKGVNGACIEIKRERALKVKRSKKRRKGMTQTQCGPASKNKIVVIDRSAKVVKEAQGHFNSALRLWKDGKATKDVGGEDEAEKKARTAAMIYYVAQANFYLAEEKYENFLDIKFPENLVFDEKRSPKATKESKKRFEKWLSDKQKALESTRSVYMHVVNDIKGGGAAWAVASAARVGQLFQNFADALYTAPIPPIPADILKLIKQAGIPMEDFEMDWYDGYCGGLEEQAMPLEEKSIEAFSFCLDTSTGLNWFNQWSKLCEYELAQIRPQDFATAGEIRAEPNLVPLTLDVQPIQKEIDTGAKAENR